MTVSPAATEIGDGNNDSATSTEMFVRLSGKS